MNIEKLTEDFEKFLLEFDEQKLDEWIKFDKRRTLLSKLQQYAVSSSNCDKGWHDGSCCCNCKNHYEDFYHCTTTPKPNDVEGCVCSTHKGWVCLISFEGETPIAHSNWSEHGMCEMHERRQ